MKILHLTGRPGDVVKKISAAINNFVPGERCELYWQLISSNVAALEKEDIFQAPQSFQGTVKSYADSIDAAFEFLFPTLNLHDRAEYQENPSQALSLLSRLPGTREQRLALNAIQGTVYLNIMRNQRGGQAQLEEAIRVAQSHEKVAPRHGWNVLSVVAGLYWYLNQLEDALQISNTANDYLGEYGDEEMRRYAKYQSLQKGTEFIIFASTRARLLFEKALREKKEKQRWMNECRKMCQQLLLAQPTIGGLGSIERARQYIFADVWL
jgi:hypothetical protein